MIFFGSPVVATSVNTTDCTRTYEYSGVIPAVSGIFALEATAKEGFEGTVTDVDSLNFEVCVDCPPTANDDSATIDQGESVKLFILDNDTDPNGNLNIGSITIISVPDNGGTALPQPTAQLFTFQMVRI